MKLLNYIDKKFSYNAQRRFTISLPIGAVVGYLLAEGMTLLIKGWQKYNFNLGGLIFEIFLWLIILSPFIYNRFKYEAKYKKILEKVKTKENNFVKAKFDYDYFKKGQTYSISLYNDNLYINTVKGWGKSGYTSNFHDFKGVVNKFEYDDLKEERLKKLKRLKRL
jgi:hypothetical protein